MDQDSLRAIATLLLFTAFTGLCITVFWGGRRADYDRAAQLPFADDAQLFVDKPRPPALPEDKLHD